MSGEKTYSLGADFLRAGIEESAALQNLTESSRRGSGGAIVYTGVLYGLRHEYRFTLTETDSGTGVRIETNGPGAEEEIQRQFLLLEKIMAGKGVGK